MSSLKSGYFWELQAWMGDHDVKVRELALLTGLGKNVINRAITGQFVRVDPRLQRKLREVTNGVVGDEQWSAFLKRRLSARTEAA
jgi:hypothetical protein